MSRHRVTLIYALFYHFFITKVKRNFSLYIHMRAETPPRFQIPRVSFSGGANATFFHFCCFIRTSTSNSKLNLHISKAKMQSKAYNAVFCTLCGRLSGSSAKCKLNLTHFPFGSQKAKFSGAKIANAVCTIYTKTSANFLHPPSKAI